MGSASESGVDSDNEEAKRKRVLSKELAKMGFGPTESAQAAAQCESLEVAVKWLLQKSDVLQRLDAALEAALPVSEDAARPVPRPSSVHQVNLAGDIARISKLSATSQKRPGLGTKEIKTPTQTKLAPAVSDSPSADYTADLPSG